MLTYYIDFTVSKPDDETHAGIIQYILAYVRMFQYVLVCSSTYLHTTLYTQRDFPVSKSDNANTHQYTIAYSGIC
jgi:hypothetical protein